MGFAKPTVDVRTTDGRNFELLEQPEYIAKDGTHYRGIVGAKSDGASTPPAIWPHFPPFGPWWLPAVMHDCGYRCSLEQLMPSGKWLRVQLDKEKIDSLFLEAMESQGVGEVDRMMIYEAVKNFGSKAFADDMAQPITK